MGIFTTTTQGYYGDQTQGLGPEVISLAAKRPGRYMIGAKYFSSGRGRMELNVVKANSYSDPEKCFQGKNWCFFFYQIGFKFGIWRVPSSDKSTTLYPMISMIPRCNGCIPWYRVSTTNVWWKTSGRAFLCRCEWLVAGRNPAKRQKNTFYCVKMLVVTVGPCVSEEGNHIENALIVLSWWWISNNWRFQCLRNIFSEFRNGFGSDYHWHVLV